MKNAIVMAALILSACSVKVSDKGPGAPKPPPVRKLELSKDPLGGQFNGAAWAPQSAIAKKLFGDDEYSVVLAGPGDAVTCDNWFPRQAHLTFSIPLAPGTFAWDANNPVSGSRLVNGVFTYTTANGGGANTVIADASVIRIDSFDGGYVRGAVAAETANAEHPYSVNGTFAALICP